MNYKMLNLNTYNPVLLNLRFVFGKNITIYDNIQQYTIIYRNILFDFSDGLQPWAPAKEAGNLMQFGMGKQKPQHGFTILLHSNSVCIGVR